MGGPQLAESVQQGNAGPSQIPNAAASVSNVPASAVSFVSTTRRRV